MISASILSVTLTVLKTIGFVLLGIIALVLLIAAEILFVPIRYKVKMKAFVRGEEKDLKLLARVSWLLHIVSFTARTDGSKVITTFKVCGIPVKRGVKAAENKESSNKSYAKVDVDKIEKEVKKEIDFEPIVSRKVYVEDAEIIDIISKDHRSNSDILDDIYEEIEDDKLRMAEEKDEPETAKEDKEPRKSFFTKVKDSLDSFVSTVKKVKGFITSLPEKIANLVSAMKDGAEQGKNKLYEVEDFINDKENRKAFELLKKETFFLLKHTKPTKIIGKLDFGLEDPATTGRLVGIYYSIFPVSPKRFSLTADFNDEHIKGDMMMRGHLRLNHLLMSFLRLRKNDRISKFMKKRKSEDK